MLTKDKAGEIFDKIKKHSSADEVEALFYGGHSALTRFANNTIHQNVAEEHYGVSVRTVFNRRNARASTHKLTAAGIFATSETIEGISNSHGLSDWHTQTSSDISVTMLGSDSSGWQKANSPNVADLDPLALAETAAKKARESASPREIPAGKYTVILEPAAVLDIVGFMFYDFGGMAIL